MKDQFNDILNFFYTENIPVSAYNNRFIFGINENDFYQILDKLEENRFIEAVGIRHTIQGYNIYCITPLGIEMKEAGGF